MGSNISKSNNETTVQVLKNDPEKDVGGNPDPRSPTPEITRTPLQNKTGAKHNITKNVDLRKTFENGKVEEKLIHNNPILSAVIKNHLQSYDPRSPTQDFERTPIIIGPKSEEDCINTQNLRDQIAYNCGSPCLANNTIGSNNDDSFEAGNVSPNLIIPKNLCEEFYEVTLNETLEEAEEPIGSSTASNEAIESNISNESNSPKPTELLETNFEYIESDKDKFEDTIETLLTENKTDIEIKNLPLFKILSEDPRSPSTGIERTPIVVATIENDGNDENVEQMSDDLLIKVLQNTNAELRQNIVQDQNKDGILIYEDESSHLNETPKKSKSVSNSGSRTPLSCMKNKTDAGHIRSKSANTLYDPKSQKVIAKVPKRVSHIPRLKSLNKQSTYFQTGSTISLKNISKVSVIGGDCENTPPHSHRDRWDKDSSIVL